MTTLNNLTAVLYKKEDLRLEQRPIPMPEDDEVLIRIDTVGICGSDMHLLKFGEINGMKLTEPIVVGHESSGIVDKIGKNVSNLKVGDRIVIEPFLPCHKCTFCKTGIYNLCPYKKLPNGHLTKYCTHAANYCHKLPDNVSFDEGAMIEPLAVAVHTCRKGNIMIGDIVLIFGAGPIGLLTLLVAKTMGASKIIVIDLVDSYLEKAKAFGATHVINSSIITNVKKHIQELLGDLPNKILDCVGAEATIRLGIEVTRPGGCVVIVGLTAHEAKIPIAHVLYWEITIKSVHAYCNDFQTAIDLVASGKVNVKSLMTDHYKLEDTLEAFETVRTRRNNALKVLIHVNANC